MTSKNTNNDIRDKRKFWLAAFLCVAGVALLFTGLFVGTAGFISGSVIGGAGELFLTAGAILGIDTIYAHKLTEIINDIKSDEPEKSSSESPD